MNKNRLYKDLAWTWPIISPPEDYVKEAADHKQLICKHSKIEVKTLLNLGCGGGHDDFGLKRYFNITGVDLSPEMLSLARKLNPENHYIQGDMRTVRLGQTFDAVCILDAVNYMLSEKDLSAAFETALTHLKPGGVFLTIVERTPKTFQQNRTKTSTHTKGDVEIVFVENIYDPDTQDTTYEDTFVYLIRKNGKLKVEFDRHVSGIFPLETWVSLLKKAGFSSVVQKVETEYPDYPGLTMLIGFKSV